MTPLSAETIGKAKQLKAVGWHGVGFDPVDVTALEARGIPLLLPGAANAVAVAEQAMALMLAVSRKIVLYDAAVRRGDWEIRESNSLSGLAGKPPPPKNTHTHNNNTHAHTDTALRGCTA